MKLEHAEMIVASMGDDWGEDKVPKLIPDYSGRGIYGKTTAAVCESWAVFTWAACFAAPNGEDAVTGFVTAMKKLQHNEMGRRIVIY